VGEPEEMGSMDTILIWIGFVRDDQRQLIIAELGDDPQEFLSMTTKDLDSVAKTMASRLPANTRVAIGYQRLKKLKASIHWAADRDRIQMPLQLKAPTDDEAAARDEFLQELEQSAQRQVIRAKNADSLSSRAKEASPGKLKDEQGWDKWEQGLQTMLSILEGVNGVPLIYAVREEDHKEGDEYTSFVEQCIARARLEGPEFEADARTVHQIIQSLTIGENAEHWLKDIAKKNDGRKDMAALRSHYRGEGNQSRRISQAKRLNETLHYKNERAMKFSDFISKSKRMFNIYEKCEEPQPESVKLRFLWKKIDCPALQPNIAAMQANLARDKNIWTFVSACDHLASQIPADDRKVTFSAVERDTGGATSSKIMKDGKLNTGTYAKEVWWDVLTQEERNKVMAGRTKSGGYTGKKKGTSTGHNRKLKALEKRVKKQSYTSGR
jgi:hypothetical protein